MPKKHEIPKLNVITFHYSGDQIKFEKFLSNMAADYINSDILPEYLPTHFVDYIEFWGDEEKTLDI